MNIKAELVIIIAAYHISINDEQHVLHISDGVIDESLTSQTLVSINNNIDFEYHGLSKDNIFAIFLIIQCIVNDEKIRLSKLKRV